MNEREGKSNIAGRQDQRVPQLSELSVDYEGFIENIILRPPDLSPHGMFINTAKTFPEGAILKLRFRLARTQTLIQARCEVRYCLMGVGVGVEFVDISAEAVRAIEEELNLQSAHR
jgi:hypothetical protein